MSDLHVIIPIPGDRGVVVVPVAELLVEAISGRGEVELDNLSIDTTFSDVEVVDLVDAVRALNATGDADAYWRARGTPIPRTPRTPG